MDESGGKIEDVDERRLNRVAYEYLCRLLQVRIWLAECLKDEQIVNVNELEENLRNGVLLARLAHSFAPEVVPLKGVFDVKQERFQQNENTPVYRHSDNIMQWRRAMESIHLPEIFIPETADVFEGRNQKTVFCLCALATLLHRLRKAPPMRNVAGQAKFTNDELSEMKLNLKDSKLPEFGDVGSLLTGRRENADLQARAIETIRDAVKSKDATELVKALKSSEAGIEFVEENLAEEYLVKLTSVDEVEFTKPFVQRIVVETNNESALEKLDRALGTDDGEQLLHILDVLQFDDVRPTALLLYSTLLQREKKNSGKSLDREKVAEIIAVANALVEVRVAVDHGSSEDVLLALRHPALQLNPSPNNARLYYNRIRKEYESKAEGEFLTRNELEFFLIEYDDISADKRQVLELKAALANKDDEAVLSFLKTSTFAEIVIEQNSEFYITKLKRKSPTSLEELGEALRDVNEETGRAFSHLDTLIRLNKAMTVDHESSVRLNLVSLGTSMKSDAFRRELLHWYIQRLIKESQHRLAQVEPRNELEKKWLHFDFEFGTVWAETVTLHRSTVPMEPVDESYFTWEEIERMLDEEDVNFDEYYKTNEQQVVKSQKNLRKFLEQKRKKQMEARQKSMEQAALTIQNHYKSYRNRKDLELLKSAEKPSLSLVRKFVKNLPRSEVSTSDEFEVAEMKSNVAQLMAANRQLDANLVELDEKIGLLIKNRLNLEEVMAHRDKTAEAADAFSMRAISMRKRDKLPLSTLEQLFFYLQTQPAHLANLIEARGKKGLDDLINDVICPIFGFLSDNREQFLMVRMLCELITRDVEKMNRLEELPTTNCVQTVAQFFTSSVFDNVIKDPCRAIDEVLGNFVEEEYRIETFNLDPLQLYTSIYGKPIETPEKALQDEQVSQVLSNSLSFLAKWSELITNALFMTYKLPRSAIYICVQLEAQLRYYFPSASSAEVEQMVAQFAYEVFLSRSLSSTKNQVRALGKQPSADAFQKLDCILQFVGFAVLNRGYGNNKWYLTSLNKQIHTIHKDFTKFVKDSARGVSLDDVYGLNEYTQFDPFQKPTLSLLEKHVYTVVEQLQKNATIVCDNKKELISTLIASAKVSPSGENDKTILLQLHPSPTERVVNGIDVQEFARAKKLVVDLLLCELAGSTLPQLLNASPTVSNEELHKSLFGDDQITSIREKQRNLNESLNNLEKDGRSSSSDNYQSVVTDIANDIRLHARRQRERAEQKKSVQEAREKLLVQREELKAKLAQYEEYLETCLQNLTRTSRRLSFRPVTEKAGKIQKQRASLDQAKSYKSSAEKLFRKGILVDVIGIQTPKQMSKLSVEIGSTADLGIFSVSLLDSNKTVETHLLEFQDLLKADSNEEQKYMLQDRVVFDVPHLIQYINKKFFNK